MAGVRDWRAPGPASGSFHATQAAKKVMLQLTDRKVGCRPFFYPMHLQPVFRKVGLFLGESYPVAERLAEKGFYIPSGLGVTAEQREYVADVLGEILTKNLI